jgi:phenylacetate-CoA ligase
MWQHRHAPLYNLRCGDGLDAFGVNFLEQYAAGLREHPPRAGKPAWLAGFVAQCRTQVPYYQSYPEADFEDLPTTCRDHLRDPERFIPEGQSLEDMTVVATSGTSGNRLRLCTHAIDVATPWVLMEQALRRSGVEMTRGPEGGVALANLTFHAQNFIYCNIAHAFGGAGFMKLNLQTTYWKDPADRVAYLDEFRPQVLAGDPLALGELLRLPLTYRPRAIFSSGMQMLEGVRQGLQERYGCPVLDVYSLTECRYLAISDGSGHRILPNDVYVEILGPDDRPVGSGERGVVTLTGGHNPFWPLLRYRTGDTATLGEDEVHTPCLLGLQGRAPVFFENHDGRRFNNIEVTKQLRPFRLLQFSLHQKADRSLRLEYLGEGVEEAEVVVRLRELFGPLPITMVRRTQEEQTGTKWILFSSDLLD